jgi:hypothetical protein
VALEHAGEHLDLARLGDDDPPPLQSKRHELLSAAADTAPDGVAKPRPCAL